MKQKFTAVAHYFQVFDMNESVRFYCETIGFEIVYASPQVDTKEGRFSHFVQLKLGAVALMLNTAYDSDERPTSRDEARWSGHEDSALYIDCVDVDALHRAFAGRGLHVPSPQLAPYGRKFIQVTDPDGYGLNFSMPT